MRSLPAPPSPLQPPRFGAGAVRCHFLSWDLFPSPQSLVWFSVKRQHWERRRQEGRGLPKGPWAGGGQLQRELELGVGGCREWTWLHPLAFGTLPRLEL